MTVEQVTDPNQGPFQGTGIGQTQQVHPLQGYVHKITGQYHTLHRVRFFGPSNVKYHSTGIANLSCHYMKLTQNTPCKKLLQAKLVLYYLCE